MTETEANDLAVKAQRLGYRGAVKQVRGSYRLYLMRADGRWSFADSEDDLDYVRSRPRIWGSVETCPAFVREALPDNLLDPSYNPLDPASGWKGL